VAIQFKLPSRYVSSRESGKNRWLSEVKVSGIETTSAGCDLAIKQECLVQPGVHCRSHRASLRTWDEYLQVPALLDVGEAATSLTIGTLQGLDTFTTHKNTRSQMFKLRL
jgi:hypothetical protein